MLVTEFRSQKFHVTNTLRLQHRWILTYKGLNPVSATCEHHYGGPSVTNDLFAHLFVDASFLIEILFAIR